MDLAHTEGSNHVRTDICIIGAGIAGLILAAKLRTLGMRVVVLESGGWQQTDDTHALNRVIQVNTPYRGALHGRARCLGGTSTLWGGALIPFLPSDLMARPHLGVPDWPVKFAALEAYLREVETLFQVDDGPFDDDFIKHIGAARDVPNGDPDLLARFAKWPTFRRRNVANLLNKSISRDVEFRIWLNATVQNFVVQRDVGRIEAIVARDPSGKDITVSALQFVLCAGAIESTRLLLWLDRCEGGIISRQCQVLGRYFFDHISTIGADIEAHRIDRLNRMAGFRFVGVTMRSLRYELSPDVQEAEGVASAFGHIKFRTEHVTGFDALRDLMGALQKTGRIDPTLFMQVTKKLPYLAKTVAWRFGRSQLYWPRPAQYELHIVAEQLPHFGNRITLGNETDSFGIPLAAIDWRINQIEYDTVGAYARRFANFWKRRGLEEIAYLNWRLDFGSPLIDLAQGSDIFHPGGSTKMGRDPQTAVVDENLRTFVLSNLSVASTSIFPTGASANPTLMLILFTLKLADRLARDIRVH